jgi:sec-independent protein translocase protein TatB
MLDVGFSEILLTSAIALIVLGPERLPKVARQVGNWMGRARAMARQLTEQLEREVNAEELLKPTKPASSTASHSVQQPASLEMGGAASGEAPLEQAAAPAHTHDTPYTSETPHGADWHPAPPENKPANE